MSGRAAPTTPVRKMFGSWGDTRYFADSRDAQTQTEKGGHTMALTGATCNACACDGSC